MRRAATAAAVAVACFGAWNVLAPHLPEPRTWGQIAVLALVSFPLAGLAIAALLPFATARPRALPAAATAGAVLAGALITVGLSGTPATLAKLVTAGCAGFALAVLLRTPAELAGIAVLVAAVDALSVAAGPTHVVVEHHEDVLDTFTLAFHPPGSYGAAQIGVSDFVFFALFVASAARMGLRPRATWAAMTASFGATAAISYATDAVLPALPLLSLGLLAPNADLIWARVRGTPASPERESGTPPI
jgi:hypothetical protein